MAVVLGSVALVIDVTSPRIAVPERKHRPLAAADAVLSLSRKDPHANAYAASRGSPKGFESDGESRNNHKAAARGKANSKPDAVDFGSDSGDDESNGNGFKVEDGGEEEENDRERRMRNRLREFEDMRELEKKAEELQSKVEESGGEGKEETEEEKRMRVKKELEKVAKEQAERRAMATLMFELGQKAYEKGTYGRAIEFLEGALTIIPEWTLFGGEIQIWLAMAYEAKNRHKDCIALYQQLEKKHPFVSIRRQAAELRFILQAPKLKISQEEMVTIPLIGSSYDSYASTWSDKYNYQQDQRGSGSTTNQLPSSRDYLGDFLVWRPPVGLEKNQGFWVAVTFWICLVGVALYIQ